jgi:hypothetical protein
VVDEGGDAQRLVDLELFAAARAPLRRRLAHSGMRW